MSFTYTLRLQMSFHHRRLAVWTVLLACCLTLWIGLGLGVSHLAHIW